MARAGDAPSTAFHAAEVRAAAGDRGAIDAFEAIGAQQPVTRWTDDAWSEAARAAERAGDLVRARRDYEHALDHADDPAFARRVRGELARLAGSIGARGEFADVAAAHERLVAQIQAGGDPKPALRELGALIDGHPAYPRAATAMLALAAGWERDGESSTARAWLRRAQTAAAPNERERVLSEVARFAIRANDPEEATTAISKLADRANAAELTAALATAQRRHAVRTLAWIVLITVVIAAIIALRRRAGSWREALRRLGHPPFEVMFLAPIAIVIAAIAWTGNPLVARAVWTLLGAGVAVAWTSGAILAGPVSTRRALAHAAVVLIAASAATYLAIDRDRMLDLVVETWQHGPESR